MNVNCRNLNREENIKIIGNPKIEKLTLKYVNLKGPKMLLESNDIPVSMNRQYLNFY